METPLALNGARTVDPELLYQEMRSGRRLTILDIRDRAACARLGVIAGALRIPAHQLYGRRSELAGLETEPIIIVSGRGVSAHAAAVALRFGGFGDVATLEGGMARWLTLGLPIELAHDVRHVASDASPR